MIDEVSDVYRCAWICGHLRLIFPNTPFLDVHPLQVQQNEIEHLIDEQCYSTSELILNIAKASSTAWALHSSRFLTCAGVIKSHEFLAANTI